MKAGSIPDRWTKTNHSKSFEVRGRARRRTRKVHVKGKYLPPKPFPYDEWERVQDTKGRDFDCGCHFCGRKLGKNPHFVYLDASHGFVIDPKAAKLIETGETINNIKGIDGLFPVGSHCLHKHGFTPYAIKLK